MVSTNELLQRELISKMGNWVKNERLVKYVYLTLTENGLPTFSDLFSFMVWESKDYMGMLIQIGIFGFRYWVIV